MCVNKKAHIYISNILYTYSFSYIIFIYHYHISYIIYGYICLAKKAFATFAKVCHILPYYHKPLLPSKKTFLKIILKKLLKNFVKQKKVHNFATANGGIAQLVRASDS